MKRTIDTLVILLLVIAGAMATPPTPSSKTPVAGAPSKTATIAQNAMSDDDMRVEGEKRFRTNCGRCHQPPHKFGPRMMATIVRHMRVRSMITDEDMKYILRYMTQ